LESREVSFSGKDLAELVQATVVKGASFRLKVKGFSMTPFIRDGDILTISPSSTTEITLGTVVAFSHPVNSGLVVHRVIRVKEERCCLKGDNISAPDGVLSKGSILGVVERVERKGRNVRVGLGRERVFIAFFSRLNFLGLPSVIRGLKRFSAKKSGGRAEGERYAK